MSHSASKLLALAALTLLAAPAASAEPIHHRMSIVLDPAAHTLRVDDHIRLDGETPLEFLLNAALEIEDSNVPVARVPTGDVVDFFGINAAAAVSDGVELARYRVDGLPPEGDLELSYGGEFDFGLSDQKEEYTRGFRETSGLVGDEGVYLAGSGFWVPTFGDGLVSFELEVTQPEGWHVVSQGDGTSRGEDGRARWDSGGPMDEIYLVGGPLEVYRDAAGAVETLVYLRQRDDALAAKYLDTTAQYLEMYRGLLGPYPYGKFALVENFWETGYGMPSFTLLGPKVIRFPFILHSSYPHEILHNWWGNSVFVDYPTGNWCEGLTAYLADHLVKEQRGQGAGYRREALQKYRNYVREGQDFPLSEFRSRHSAATEAVGYGKTLMGFHMLRRRLGDEVFVRSLQRFYRQQKGKRASFADLRQAFEAVSEDDLGRFFDDWVRRPGAADLSVTVDGVREADGGFVVAGRLEQSQTGDPYTFEVPVVVLTAEGEKAIGVALDGRRTSFEVYTAGRPLALYVDPAFDVFRLLDPRETPPSIGQIFGEPEILAVLPAAAGEDEIGRYRELMEAWRSDSHAIEARLDTEVEDLPPDRGVWILGRANRFADRLAGPKASFGFEIDPDGLTVEGEKIPFVDHSLVLIRRHPGNPDKAVGWLVVEPAAAFPGLARKLPHYGKYSYL
ncbi:MAG: M1 family aminopeptidase, partial [Thermoanaerobaculia bacterium]